MFTGVIFTVSLALSDKSTVFPLVKLVIVDPCIINGSVVVAGVDTSLSVIGVVFCLTASVIVASADDVPL